VRGIDIEREEISRSPDSLAWSTKEGRADDPISRLVGQPTCERLQGSDLLLVEVVVDEHTVLGDAKIDFAHHRAYFARDLRIAPGARHDRSDDLQHVARRPPYPRQSGRGFLDR
jgi:hypothetical protein